MLDIKTIGSLIVHHCVACAVLLLAMLGLAFLSYMGLLLWAVLAGAPLGGPLALPFLLLATVVAAVAASLVLGPITLAVRSLRVRLGWHVLAEIPLATVVTLLVVTGIAAVWALVGGTRIDEAVLASVLVWLVLLAPLGVYWWTLQGCAGTQRGLGWLARSIRRWIGPRANAVTAC